MYWYLGSKGEKFINTLFNPSETFRHLWGYELNFCFALDLERSRRRLLGLQVILYSAWDAPHISVYIQGKKLPLVRPSETSTLVSGKTVCKASWNRGITRFSQPLDKSAYSQTFIGKAFTVFLVRIWVGPGFPGNVYAPLRVNSSNGNCRYRN